MSDHNFGFFDTTYDPETKTYETVYDAADFATAMEAIIGNCILHDTDFPLTKSEIDYTITIGTGVCWINGYWFKCEEVQSLRLDSYALLYQPNMTTFDENNKWFVCVSLTVAARNFEINIKRQNDLTNADLALWRIDTDIAEASNAASVEFSDMRGILTPIYRNYTMLTQITSEEIDQIYDEVFGSQTDA